jgi:hypothetical protein
MSEWRYSSIILDLALDGVEWSASLPGISGEKAPVTHWTGGRVDPRAGLDCVEYRNILCPCWESNLGLQSRNPSLLLAKMILK